MIYKTLGKGLGVFSLLVGAAQLFGAKRIARTLDAEGHERLIKGFGARQLLAGASLMAAPAASTNMWGRVAGDAMDLGALGLAARRSPRNRAIWGAIACVGAVTLLDIVTARGLDRTTGKFLPRRERAATA